MILCIGKGVGCESDGELKLPSFIVLKNGLGEVKEQQMFKFNVTPFVLTGTENNVAVLEEGDTKQFTASSSIKAALQYRPTGVQFWLIRKAR